MCFTLCSNLYCRQSATKIQYYVSVYEDRNSVDEDDLDSPTNPTLKADIENGIPGINIHTEPLKKKTSEPFVSSILT